MSNFFSKLFNSLTSFDLIDRYPSKHYNFVIDRLTFVLMFVLAIPVTYNFFIGTKLGVIGTVGYWFITAVIWWRNRYKPSKYIPWIMYFSTLGLGIVMMVFVDGIRSSVVSLFPAMILIFGFSFKTSVYKISIFLSFTALLITGVLEYYGIIKIASLPPLKLIFIYDVLYIYIIVALCMYMVMLYIKHKENSLKLINDTKDNFLDILSHDLRSPFQTLIGVSTFLKENFKNLNDEEKENSIKLLADGIKDQYYLLEDLLRWGEIQSGNYNNKFNNCYLKSIISETLSSIVLVGQKKEIQIENQVASDVQLKCETILIATAIRNIISNAIKFTNAGSIIISSEQKDDQIILSVTDTGIGMSEKQIKDILKNKISVSAKDGYGVTGTGLGLQLVKHIVKIHDADFNIESEVGKGSKVIILFKKL
ncbi:MAG: HAMP domain-containing histidine kinase [Melioribacteraceae bacterium]|nr:HAMP domain-containing histidine kinase [Melioribacteraceae bacterium]